MGVMEIKGDDQVVVHNRNGHMLIGEKGQIDSIYIDDGIEDFTGHFRYITGVDLDEWRNHYSEAAPEDLMIPDVAYWYKMPEASKEAYQSADPKWRADEGEFRRKTRQGKWP